MGRSKRQRGSRSKRPGGTFTAADQSSLPKRRGTFRLGTTIAALSVVGAGLLALVLAPKLDQVAPPGSESPVVQPAVSPQTPLSTFDEVISLSTDELAKRDVAKLNLLAAKGLPGAENLDIERIEAELDRWADHVRRETDRHLYKFRADPAAFQDSEAYFRVLMLITVLQQDLGVRYNPERVDEPDFTNSKDLFIHGMVNDDNGGTCVSMPVLTAAVARRLDYPLRLVVTKGHVFARWDAPNHPQPNWRDRFNVECTSRGLNTFDDTYYTRWPYELSNAEIGNDWYLRSLTPAEELAVFLIQRGHCLEDVGRTAEAKSAYAAAARLAPTSEAGQFLAQLEAGVERERTLRNNLQSIEEAIAQREARRRYDRYIRRTLQRQEQELPNLGPRPPLPGVPGGGW